MSKSIKQRKKEEALRKKVFEGRKDKIRTMPLVLPDTSKAVTMPFKYGHKKTKFAK